MEKRRPRKEGQKFGGTADRGQIALQAEGPEVEFRRIEIGPLAAAAK